MSLESTVQEIVVPDVHNNWAIYQRLNELIDKETKRVFLVGDLRPDERIDYDFIKANLSTDHKKLYAQVEPIQHELAALIENKYGDVESFLHAQQSGRLTEDEKKLIKKYAEAMRVLEQCSDEVFAKESAVDYDRHEKEIKAIQKQHPNLKFYGVPGNHDTIFIRDQVKSVDWLVYSQSLKSEGIIGAFGCRENSGEINPQFNGPQMKYLPFLDDDYEDLTKSKIYKDFHGVPINLLVTHSGGEWADAHTEIQEDENEIKYTAGKGITKLGEENGFVCYEGHLHRRYVAKDPASKVTIVRPGVRSLAKVWRRGKNVEKYERYDVTRRL